MMRIFSLLFALLCIASAAVADDVDWLGRSIADDLPDMRADARGSDRPGGDFWLIQFPRRAEGDAGLGPCIRYCALSPRCAAYTYVKQTASEGGKCFLKNSVPARAASPCCESGVKADWGPPSAAVLARAPRNGNPPTGEPFPLGRPLETTPLGPIPPTTPPVPPPPEPSVRPISGMSIQNNMDRPGSDETRIDTDDPNLCNALCNRYSYCRAFTWVRPRIQAFRGVCYLKNAVPAARPDSCCLSGVKDAGGTPVPVAPAPARTYMAGSPGFIANETGAGIIGRFVYGDPRWPSGFTYSQGTCQIACDDPARFFGGRVTGRCVAFTIITSPSELSCTLFERVGSGPMLPRPGGRSFFVR